MSKLSIALAVPFALLSLTAAAQGGATSGQAQQDPSFLELDSNLDGKITQQEANRSEKLKQAFNDADSNQDGGIDASEFSAFIAKSADSGAAQSGSAQPGAQTSFNQLDSNRDGKLSRSETQSDHKLSQQFQSIDKDRDGAINPSEFSAFTGQSGQAGGQRASFEQLDSNRDGYLSTQEVQEQSRVAQQFTTADANGDGYLDQQEYLAAAGGAGSTTFSALDMNRDGNISQDEADADPMLAQQFQQVDSNGDGAINQSEFSAFETSRESGSQ